MKEYVCDVCGSDLEFDEVGYLGSENESCSPFMKLDCRCVQCVREEKNEKTIVNKKGKGRSILHAV